MIASSSSSWSNWPSRVSEQLRRSHDGLVQRIEPKPDPVGLPGQLPAQPAAVLSVLARQHPRNFILFFMQLETAHLSLSYKVSTLSGSIPAQKRYGTLKRQGHEVLIFLNLRIEPTKTTNFQAKLF